LIGALPVLLIFIGPNLRAAAKAEPAQNFWNVQSRALADIRDRSVLIAARSPPYAAKDIVLAGLTTATAPAFISPRGRTSRRFIGR
jgi:hypothetical protein